MVRRTYDNGWQENKVCFSTSPILLDTELFESWPIFFYFVVRHTWDLLKFSSFYSPFREALRAKLISSGVLDEEAYVVIVGPANTYAHYVTTPEEYAAQRYEGASTIFGQCE